MVSLDLGSLVRQVIEIVANPTNTPAQTGDAAMDRALSDLRGTCADAKPLDSQIQSTWH